MGQPQPLTLGIRLEIRDAEWHLTRLDHNTQILPAATFILVDGIREVIKVWQQRATEDGNEMPSMTLHSSTLVIVDKTQVFDAKNLILRRRLVPEDQGDLLHVADSNAIKRLHVSRQGMPSVFPAER